MIPEISQITEINELVSKMIESKGEDKDSDNKINLLVYKIYELTDEEISEIEEMEY